MVGISWYEANAYCNWLTSNYRNIPDYALLANNFVFRLPTEIEWILAAGGLGEPLITKNKKGEERKFYRFAWDELGKVTPEPQSNEDEIMQDILRRTNVFQGGINRTSPVSMYPLGKTKNGIWDMSGNVWEWQANFSDKSHKYLGLRGGSWSNDADGARVAVRDSYNPHDGYVNRGFRVVAMSLPNSS